MDLLCKAHRRNGTLRGNRRVSQKPIHILTEPTRAKGSVMTDHLVSRRVRPGYIVMDNQHHVASLPQVPTIKRAETT